MKMEILSLEVLVKFFYAHRMLAQEKPGRRTQDASVNSASNCLAPVPQGGGDSCND